MGGDLGRRKGVPGGASQREKQPERPGSRAGAGNGKQYCLSSHKEHENDKLCSLSLDNVTNEPMKEIPGTADWEPEGKNFFHLLASLPSPPCLSGVS